MRLDNVVLKTYPISTIQFELLTQIDDKILNWPEKIFILEVAILFFLSPNFAPQTFSSGSVPAWD